MADIKKANRADLSAAKKVEKVVKPAAELSIAERRPAGQFHLDLNAKPDPNYLRAYRDIGVPYKDLYKDIGIPHKVLHKVVHRDVHWDVIFKGRDHIDIQLAKGVTLDRQHILQLEKIGGKIENNKLSISAEKAADLEQFIIRNDLKSILEM
jgi:hypothetical protein